MGQVHLDDDSVAITVRHLNSYLSLIISTACPLRGVSQLWVSHVVCRLSIQFYCVNSVFLRVRQR